MLNMKNCLKVNGMILHANLDIMCREFIWEQMIAILFQVAANLIIAILFVLEMMIFALI